MQQVKGLSEIDFIEHGFCDAHDSNRVRAPILMNQVHSADVLVLEAAPTAEPAVDALITTKSGLTLTVKTADCAPVLIADTKAHIVAAIHAGWKGAFQGVIESTILKMCQLGGHTQDMVAGIGPHLQQESFEVDQTLFSLFPKTEHVFFTKKDPTHYLFDFHAYVRHRLNRAGINRVDSVYIDTFQEKQYNSYRRDPVNPARQFSFIRLK